MVTVKATHDIGTALRQRRQRVGLSQRKLARLSGVGSTSVRRLETGHATGVRPDTLHAIEAALSRAEQLPSGTTLPPLLPYLRARYPYVPERLVHEVADYFDYLTKRYGSASPINGADER